MNAKKRNMIPKRIPYLTARPSYIRLVACRPTVLMTTYFRVKIIARALIIGFIRIIPFGEKSCVWSGHVGLLLFDNRMYV